MQMLPLLPLAPSLLLADAARSTPLALLMTPGDLNTSWGLVKPAGSTLKLDTSLPPIPPGVATEAVLVDQLHNSSVEIFTYAGYGQTDALRRWVSHDGLRTFSGGDIVVSAAQTQGGELAMAKRSAEGLAAGEPQYLVVVFHNGTYAFGFGSTDGAAFTPIRRAASAEATDGACAANPF